MDSPSLSVPWQAFGTSISGINNWKTAATKARLNWSVSKRQLFTTLRGRNIPIDAWGVFRNDNNEFLEPIERDTPLLQNKNAFQFVDEILTKIPGASYDTAGSLFGGKYIFTTISLPQSVNLSHELLHCYMLFETSHDGSARHIKHLESTGKLMILCSSSNSVLPVTINLKEDIALTIKENISLIEDKLKILMKEDITRKAVWDKHIWTKTMKKLFGNNCYKSYKKQHQLELIDKLFHKISKIPAIAHSAYALLQAYIVWIDHYRTTRKPKRPNNLDENQLKIQSAIFYDGAAKKEQAFNTIFKLTMQE